MIKKIGTIKHFAVFENYNWDLSSTDKNGQPLKLEKSTYCMEEIIPEKLNCQDISFT